MKNKLLVTLVLLLCTTSVYAITLGFEPPVQYMNALKNCTKGTFSNVSKFGTKYTYSIKGSLPDGRCEVQIDSYTDYVNNEQAYKYAINMIDFASMAKSMGAKESDLKKLQYPTPAQLSEDTKEKIACKFSKVERQNLYNAFLKHDNKNPEPQMGKDGSMNLSFYTSKMSSYDKLMMNYSSMTITGPCRTYDKNGELNKDWNKYACEYNDTTCYVAYTNDGTSSVSCQPEKGELSETMWNTVVNHAKSGKCIKL